MNFRIAILGLSVLISACAPAPEAEPANSENQLEPILLRGDNLAYARELYAQGDSAMVRAVEALITLADAAVESEAQSVTFKPHTPPSGDKHDYMSMGPYWWPDPEKEDGLPYIRRDGEVNPERWEYDKSRIVHMQEAVYQLALAYHFTGNEDYAKHARRHLDVWFFDADTRMNPNFNHGQFIPGRSDGRAPGVIEARAFSYIMDSAILLMPSESWTQSDMLMLQDWYAEFSTWLLESPIGQDEAAAKNNHGSWYSTQLAAYASFSGRPDLAKQIIAEVGPVRMEHQLAEDGSQPHELKRTKSFSYSSFNLHAWMQSALLGEEHGIDLWNWPSQEESSIFRALDFLVEHYKAKAWPFPEMNDPFYGSHHFVSCLYEADRVRPDAGYGRIADELMAGVAGESRYAVYKPLTLTRPQ